MCTHLDRERERDLTTGLLLFGRDLERERLRDERRERDLYYSHVLLVQKRILT